MELDELTRCLERFCRAKYEDEDVEVFGVHKMPGHAGFSYGFAVRTADGEEAWFLRLPPPNVRWKGTADVLRQVEILKALDETDVPHCPVKWSGEEPEWFGCPYFVVPRLEGDVLRLGKGEWGEALAPEQLHDLGRQAMKALAGIHRVDWQRKTPYLGPPIPLDQDVLRWDRFHNRLAEPERMALAPEVRRKLLGSLPTDPPVGVFHGDFQTSNLFCSPDGTLSAVIDWELVGIGATLNDIGWMATFSDPKAWAVSESRRSLFLDPDTLIGLYAEAWGKPLPDLGWYRALGAYKFAIITGFNLGLHRRGKRPDPHWEDLKYSMHTLVGRALELLG